MARPPFVGIVPTGFENLEKEDTESLISFLEKTWDVLVKRGIDKGFMLSKSLLSPATCCLINPDREKTVEKAFQSVRILSKRLREKYVID